MGIFIINSCQNHELFPYIFESKYNSFCNFACPSISALQIKSERACACVCVCVIKHQKRSKSHESQLKSSYFCYAPFRFIALTPPKRNHKSNNIFFSLRKTVLKLNFRTNFVLLVFFFALSFPGTTIRLGYVYI